MEDWEPFKPEYENIMIVIMVITCSAPVIMSKSLYGHWDALSNERMLPILSAYGILCLVGAIAFISSPLSIFLAFQAAGSLLFAGVCHLEMRHERLQKIVEAIS